MVDIKAVALQKEAYKKAVKDKGLALDIDALLTLYEERKSLLIQKERLLAERNTLQDIPFTPENKQEMLQKGSILKQQLKEIEEQWTRKEGKYQELLLQVPTLPSGDTPIGASDKENKEVYTWGEKKTFPFTPKDHIALGTSLDILDFDRGVKTAGFRGYYVKNEGVILMLAFLHYALETLIKKGFTPMLPPTIVKEFALFGSGYFKDKTYNPQTDEIFALETHDQKEKRFLVGTSEVPLLSYYANESVEAAKLPLKLCGYSQCYRSEIGSYGKDTKGMYRVHEFLKVEQVVIGKADTKEAEQLHQDMMAVSKKLHEDLGLSYRILQICTGDLHPGKYKSYDIEAWLPGKQSYAETGSASNFLDWQSRRLNISYKDEKGNKQYVYTLNNTALPSPRIFIALLETYQQEDGSVVIPPVLRPYTMGITSIKQK